MELYCDRLARALAGIINILDPHAIVLGGGLSRMSQLYDARARAVAALRLLRARAHRDPAAAAQARQFERRARCCLAVAGVNQRNGGSSKLRSLRECSERQLAAQQVDRLEADLQVLADRALVEARWRRRAA